MLMLHPKIKKVRNFLLFRSPIAILSVLSLGLFIIWKISGSVMLGEYLVIDGNIENDLNKTINVVLSKDEYQLLNPLLSNDNKVKWSISGKRPDTNLKDYRLYENNGSYHLYIKPDSKTKLSLGEGKDFSITLQTGQITVIQALLQRLNINND